MDSNDFILKAIESFGPKVFEINGCLSFWTIIIETFNEKRVNQLLELIEDMDSQQKYDFVKHLLKYGFDSIVDQKSHPNHKNNDSDEETEIDENHFESDDNRSDKTDRMSDCSTKTYETALDLDEHHFDASDEESFGSESDDRTTRSLVDIENDFSDVNDIEEDSMASGNGLSGQILSLSTITSIGSQRSGTNSQSNVLSDESDNSFHGF